MALTKRVYVDGETIITAQNLNDIQDEIISQGNTLVPKTRTVNDKPLSTDITISASDIGAAPTSHASSATTYGKGTSSNYGHVKLTDALDSTSAAASGGTALSAKAGKDLKDAIDLKGKKVVVVTTKTLTGECTSEAGLTSSNSNITSDMVVINSRFSTPVAVRSDVVVVTTNGNVNITGTFAGTGTTITLMLAEAN